MPLLTEEQIQQARSIDLLVYLQTHEPSNVRQSKGKTDEYYLVEHDSLKMSNGMWFRHSTQYGGYSALDFLIKVRGYHFVDAVVALTGGYALSDYRDVQNSSSLQSNNHSPQSVKVNPQSPLPTEQSPQHEQQSPPKHLKPKPFVLPKPNRNNDQVIAYLRGRGIERDVINRCINEGTLYESNKHTCVFVGKDEYGKARFACERGISDDMKKDVSGSSKKYSFCLPPISPNPTSMLSKTYNYGGSTLAIFESSVDVLAHASIHEIGQTGWDGYRLSLGGVSSIALHGFLERNPQVANIQLCLDNDRAGHDATNRIIAELLSDKRYTHMKFTVAHPPIGKDYADTILAIKRNSTGITDINRPKEAVI